MHIGTFAICAFWLIAQLATAATPLDFTDCGSHDLDRQIARCSHIIEEPLFPAETLARAHHFRGLAHENKGEFAEALADYDEAIRLGPEVATVYFSRGKLYQETLDYDRSIADLNEAIRLDPKLTIAYDWRGLSYYYKGDNNRAIADFDTAIRIDPSYASGYWNRGKARENSARPKRCRR
jgi:tetratricopeptide (TPR) repeat protein